MTREARIIVSVGCPCGIGPEVALAALRRPLAGARVALVCDAFVAQRAAELASISLSKLVFVSDEELLFRLPKGKIGVLSPGRRLAAKDRTYGRPTPKSGAAQLAWIDTAARLVLDGKADAIVTGPVSKDVIARSGAPGSHTFRGHTEHLQDLSSAKEVVMAFATPALTTALVTTHLPIARVPKAITASNVARACFWLGDLLARKGAPAAKKHASQRIAVCGLNPHAGEHGMLGTEEKYIERGMALARARAAKAGIPLDLVGPLPAESAFRLAQSGAFRGVVAMYHDQATIPMKLLAFGDAVNISLGLPILRTSVDHGTAYDLAGQGRADAAGMRAALELAVSLSTPER